MLPILRKQADITHMATTKGIATRGKFGFAMGIPGRGVGCTFGTAAGVVMWSPYSVTVYGWIF